MFAIETYFIAPGNVRGSRIAARVMDRGTGFSRDNGPRKVTLSWDHRLNPDGNHKAAALALADKLGWHGQWVAAGGDDGATIWANVSALGIDTFTVQETQAAPA